MSYDIISYNIILYYSILYYIILYYIILYYIILYYIYYICICICICVCVCVCICICICICICYVYVYVYYICILYYTYAYYVILYYIIYIIFYNILYYIYIYLDIFGCFVRVSKKEPSAVPQVGPPPSFESSTCTHRRCVGIPTMRPATNLLPTSPESKEHQKNRMEVAIPRWTSHTDCPWWPDVLRVDLYEIGCYVCKKTGSRVVLRVAEVHVSLQFMQRAVEDSRCWVIQSESHDVWLGHGLVSLARSRAPWKDQWNRWTARRIWTYINGLV